MMSATLEAIRAILRADPSVTPADRATILAAVRNHGKTDVKQASVGATEARILHRAEVAKRLGCSLRSVDNIARQGVVRKVFFPGRKRAWGFRLADIEMLIASEGNDERK